MKLVASRMIKMLLDSSRDAEGIQAQTGAVAQGTPIQVLHVSQLRDVHGGEEVAPAPHGTWGVSPVTT